VQDVSQAARIGVRELRVKLEILGAKHRPNWD